MAQITQHNPSDTEPDCCKFRIDELLYHLQQSLSPEEVVAAKEHMLTLANLGEEIYRQYADKQTGSRIATTAILAAAYGFCIKLKIK